MEKILFLIVSANYGPVVMAHMLPLSSTHIVLLIKPLGHQVSLCHGTIKICAFSLVNQRSLVMINHNHSKFHIVPSVCNFVRTIGDDVTTIINA